MKRNTLGVGTARSYFEHNAPVKPLPDVVEWKETGDVEHVEMWTDDNGLACHTVERK
jgi:hypothetical protein